MVVILHEDEIRQVLQEHILTKQLKDVNVLVVNEYMVVRHESRDEIEFDSVVYTLELEQRKPKEETP